MKINLKNKIMLAILAGNMLCMGSAWADTYQGVVSGGKAGCPNYPSSTSYYTGTVGGTGTGEYATQGATVTIVDGIGAETHNYTYIYGGCGSLGLITLNAVIISGGTLGNVCGGSLLTDESGSGNKVSSNSVTITGGVVNGYVYGGYSVRGDVSSNSVMITGGTIGVRNGIGVAGGYSSNSGVRSNIVTISGGKIYGDVNGGLTNQYPASNNNATISNAIIDGGVYGGHSKGGYYGNANNGNSVTISNGTTTSSVYGAYSQNGAVSNNSVNIKDSRIKGVYGGYSLDDYSDNSISSGNTVTVSNSTTGSVYGAYSKKSILRGNTVTIKSGFISGNVYGGYSSSNDATDNIVTIESGSFGNYGIYGGRSTTKSTGNIFNLKTRLSGVKEVAYFQKINFTLPSDVANGDTIVSAEKFYVDTKGGRVEFTVSASDSISLKKGDIITLIDSADTNNSDVYVDNDSVLDGTAKVYRENGESKNSDGDTNDIILEMLDDLIILEPEVPTSDFLADSDISNIAEAADGKLQEFLDNVSETFGDDTKMATNAVNTMASANILAGTQHAAVSVTNHIANSIYNSVDVVNRPKLSSKNDIVKLRDVCTDKDICKCDVVELGKQSGIMPVRWELTEYDKQVWASIVHSKEKIEGMKTGSLEQDSTVQYNGTTAGADLWSSNKGFGGVALTYADGNTESSQKTGNIRNDADYYGVSVYHRQDIGNIDIVSDISYTHTDNDITTDIAGNEITARPKVDVYSAGTKIEAELRLSKASKLVPYLGARYSRLQNKGFTNSLGGRFDVDNANLFTVPVGLALRSHLKTSEGWDFGSVLEGGYEWNLGDRDSTQKFSYGGAYDIIGFDIVDSGQYYIKAALTAAYQNLLFELLYRYSKGKTTRDNNWRLNVNWGF